MRKYVKYTVSYGKEIAKFSDYRDALTFAQLAGNSEVRNKTGLIAQFVEGRPTEEFKHLNI